MRAVARTFAVVVGLGACAGGTASGPMYSFAPSTPLQYDVVDHTNILVEAPGMTVETLAQTEVALSVLVTDAGNMESGASVTFDSFMLDVSGNQGGFSHDGGGMVGSPFSGHFASEGGFIVANGPEIPGDLLAQFDPATVLVALFPPLPEGGAQAGAWPHRYEITDRTDMAVTSMFDGQARFEGDTVVNGRAGRIIVSEGVASLTGHGQPQGSPAPMDLDASMTVRSVWVWDPATGAMIGARIEAEGSGNMSVQGFDIPLAVSATTTVTLRR